MTETLLRQLEMLRHIPHLPRKISAADLLVRLSNAGYEVDLRTIQRDLNKLAIPLQFEGDEAKPQGWHRLPNAKPLDTASLSPQAALVFNLVEKHLQSLLPGSTLAYLDPWFSAAQSVLASHSHALTQWPDKIRVLPKGQPQIPPKIDPEVETAVYLALLEDKQLALAYRRRNADAARDYTVSPLGVVVRDRLIYLVCWHERTIKQLSLHRIQSASAQEAVAERPADFDLDIYIKNGEFGWPVGKPSHFKLVADFTHGAAVSLEECPLSDDQTIKVIDDENVRITATVQNTLELRAWLRSFGDDVEIIKPKALREEFRELATTLVDYYEDEPD